VKYALVLSAAVLLLSQQAVACPVCFSPKNEENRTAFVLMTGFLTALPLGLVGSGVWWYRRRMKQFEKRIRAERRSAQKAQTRAAEPGKLLKASHGYFGRGYAGTPRAR
jgi:hypothetical protein